ncbi:Rv3235 family protein [Planomonospora corallina]|uniref:Rv3235 family protein n=1 Tax=Planomonospora corallina TaxID=1806052 RepID=A0ABV8I1M5_9ACTN
MSPSPSRSSRSLPLPRINPSPVAEPPYDEEHPSREAGAGAAAPYRRGPYVQGTLALTAEPEPVAPPPRRPLVWGPPGAVPDERRLRALGQAVVEILAGRRPPASVSCHLTRRAHAELIRAGKVFDCTRPPRVGAPHISQPRDGVVEMCLLAHCGERSRVLALRLERRGVQWLCTDFETAP